MSTVKCSKCNKDFTAAVSEIREAYEEAEEIALEIVELKRRIEVLQTGFRRNSFDVGAEYFEELAKDAYKAISLATRKIEKLKNMLERA